MLATNKQQPGETLKEFFHLLHLLSKDCALEAVTAEKYRNELVREAFVIRISLLSINQSPLKTNRLTVKHAFDKACCLRTAQKDCFINDKLCCNFMAIIKLI